MSIIEGTVAFANLDEMEEYQGQSTGKYSVVIKLDEEGVDQLRKQGIKVKEYKETFQRKFSTKFEDFKVVNAEGEPLDRAQIEYPDRVRIKYSTGRPHPVHGTSVYLDAVKLLEKGEIESADDEF